MNNKILTEDGLVDEGNWDKFKKFAQGYKPNLKTAYMQSFNKPTSQTQPPVIQQPTPQQSYKGQVPPVIPRAAVPPVVPTQGMSLNTKAGTFGVNLTAGGPPANSVPAEPVPQPQPVTPAQPIPMTNKNISYDQQRKQQQTAKRTQSKKTRTVPTKSSVPSALNKSPERGPTGVFKLQENFITKNQLKTLIKSVASVLKES